MNYLSTNLAQTLLVSSAAGRLSNFGAFVPDLVDYTENNAVFASDSNLPTDHEYFGMTLEQRLYSYFGLTDDEVEEIENR